MMDLSDVVDRFCDTLDLKKNYVSRITIDPHQVTVLLYKGRDGRCKGEKYCVDADGEPCAGRLKRPGEPDPQPAMEEVVIPVFT